MDKVNPYDKYKGLYQDATGKGAVVPEPIAAPELAKKNQESLRPGGVAAEAVMKEDADYLASLFDGEELSEEFKEKAKTIFEAAINEKVSIIEAYVIAASKEIIEEQLTVQQEQLVEHVDGYLNYVIAEWMDENKVAIERGLRTEIAENFIMGLKNLFESSFIDVPEEKYNILDDLYDANEELQESANALIKENIQLKNEITARLCAEAFIEEAQGLADTQVEKLAKLAEGIEFNDVDQYRQKVALLKESYFSTTKEESKQPAQLKVSPAETQQFASKMMTMLSEDTSTDSTEITHDIPGIDNIVNTLSVLNKGKANNKKLFENAAADRVRSLLNSGTVQDNFN